MTTLIIPAAGLSTRYGLGRPKFLLQAPFGGLMITAGLAKLPKGVFREVIVVSMRDYFAGLDVARIEDEISNVTGSSTRLVLLDRPTASPVHTILEGIAAMRSDDSIVVKDSDNLVGSADIQCRLGEDFVTFFDLRKFPHVTASNKSFVELDGQFMVSNIVEKRVVSSQANTGLIGFSSASTFAAAANRLLGASEIYVSDVVRVLVDDKIRFAAVEADQYEDWGTLEDWRSYQRRHMTVFVDLDGVVAENENPYSAHGGWDRIVPILPNAEVLQELASDGRAKIIFTTARREAHRHSVENGLKAVGFEDFVLIMDLPHAQRILINDFAPTNPFPSAQAINIPRNQATLRDYFGVTAFRAERD